MNYIYQSLAVILFSFVATGCNVSANPIVLTESAENRESSASKNMAEEVTTIEWWTVDSEEHTAQTQREMAKAFEADYPYIKINVSVLPENEFREGMNTALNMGEGAPDVAFFWNSAWYPHALDLRPFITQDDFDTNMYIQGFWQTRSLWEDKVIGLPLGVGAQFVMYNKDIFDEQGVPYPSPNWSTEDYITLAKQLYDPNADRWGGDRPRRAYRAIWFNYGARPYNDESTTVAGYFNGPEAVAAYTWLWDLVQTNASPTPADIEKFGNEGTGPVDLFLDGRLAMATLNQGHMVNAVKAKAKFGIVPEPRVDGYEHSINAWSLTASIWDGTEHPEEAWTFLKWWVGPEGQRFLMNNGNLFPSIPAVLREYKDADQVYAQQFFEILELPQIAEWRSHHPCNGKVAGVANDLWDRIMLNEITRDEIQAELDALVPTAQKALDECRAELGR